MVKNGVRKLNHAEGLAKHKIESLGAIFSAITNLPLDYWGERSTEINTTGTRIPHSLAV